MSLQEIEQAAKELPPNELDCLVTRLHDFFNECWDKQMEDDAKQGRLHKLINEAREDICSGRTRSL